MNRRAAFVLALMASCFVVSTTYAESEPIGAHMDARETAEVKGEPGSYSVGIFNPLTLTVLRDFEIQTHPLLFFVSPNAIARVPHYKPTPSEPKASHWAITGEYGLSVPTLGMRLSQGTLFPAWEHDEGKIGWTVVPRAGWLATFTDEDEHALTFRLDAAVGFTLTHNDAQPLDAPAPLELLFAPALNRYRGRIGVLYDYSVNSRFRLRGYADGYLLGRESEFRAPTGFDNITTRLGVGADIGFCRRYECRFTFGAAWWNSDQHAIDTETFESVRSNDIWPTLDFIWQG